MMRNFVPNYTYFVMIKRSILLLSWAVAALGLVACHGEGDTEDEELLAPVVTPVDDSEALPGNPQGHGGAMLPGTDIEIPSSFENVLLNVQSSTTYQPETFAQALANSPMLNFFGDDQSTMAMVAVPLFRLTENQTKAGGKSYNYYFTVESSVPLMKSGHAVELSTIFNHPEETLVAGRAFDKTFSKTLRKMWVQFAKTGNPSLSAKDSPDGKAHEWPLYDLENKEIMVFDEFNIHPEKESQRKILDWERTYFLTKYFCM